MPRRRIALPFFILALSAVAPALEITTRLLDAEAGAWIRNDWGDHYTTTLYVPAVTDDVVTLQIIHEHRRHLKYNKIVHIPKTYIREQGIDPDAPDAVHETIEVGGRSYPVTGVRRNVDGRDTTYYFLDGQPVTGILQVKVVGDVAPTRVTTNYLQSGSEPDATILGAGSAEEANSEFGIPRPSGE